MSKPKKVEAWAVIRNGKLWGKPTQLYLSREFAKADSDFMDKECKAHPVRVSITPLDGRRRKR